MKKLILLIALLLIPVVARAGGFGISKSGGQTSITFSHTVALESVWVVFGYDGDGGADTANMYDSLKLLPVFSGDGKELWGDGLELDSIGGHVVKIRGYNSDNAIAIITSGTYFHNSNESAVADTLANRGYVTGAGAYACTVFTKLTADSSALDGIHVIALNTAQDNKLGHCYTNANGWCIMALDIIAGGALHKFWLMDVDYDFTFPEEADINTDTGVTFYGSAFDYGDPPAENQCAVYGQLFDSQLDSLSGAIIKARVYVPPDSVLRYDDHVISPFIVSDTTTVTGRWRLDLIPNSLFTPTGTWYIFIFEKPSPWGGTIVDEDTLTVPELESQKY